MSIQQPAAEAAETAEAVEAVAAPPKDPPVDPRGPRFAAWVTTAVLVIVLLSGSAWLAAAQAAVFALGAFAGLRFSPYSAFYRAVVAPRLSPPGEREAAAPLRFAQGVGFAFAAVATIGFVTGLDPLGYVATAFALGAAALNAVFGICLGCEVYLRLPRRLQRALAA
jgi:Domain of unknown function (DUF4395)